MTMVLSICVAVTFAVSIYLFLGRELKGVAMGVFLLGHAANLSILAMSGSPVLPGGETAFEKVKGPPISTYTLQKELHADDGGSIRALDAMVDPLPQALILTAIVIGFAVMGFLLTLLVTTARAADTLELDELAGVDPDALAQAADRSAGGAA